MYTKKARGVLAMDDIARRRRDFVFYNLLIVSTLRNAAHVCLDYCKKNPLLAVIVLVLGLAMVGLIIAIPCVASARKKKRLAWEAEEKAKAEAEAQAKAEAEEKAKAEAEAQAKAEAEEKAKAEAEAQAKAKTEAKTTPTAVATEPVAENNPTVVVTEPAAESTQAVETENTAESEAQNAEINTVQPVPAPVEMPNNEPKPEQDTPQGSVSKASENLTKATRYAGKWVVFHMVSGSEDGVNKDEDLFFFELHASNGEKLLSSEEYTSYAGAVRGIETHKKNILADNFRVTLSKKGHYIFKLLNGKSTLLCTGANYPNKARCEKAIESTKRFAETAVLDENTRELFVKLPPEEDAPIAALPDGCVGKWVIFSNSGEDGETVYYFELFANNGEKLLSSEEYSSYIGAVNGIETHKKNISAGNFRLSLTKRGDYIYKLLNGNGQLLCLGEHYRTRRLCQNAVESVKRFALGSPTLTNEKTKQS